MKLWVLCRDDRLSCPQANRNLGVPTRRRDSPRWALESARLPWQVQRGGVAPNVSFFLLVASGQGPQTQDHLRESASCKAKTLTLTLPNHQVLEAKPKLPQGHRTANSGSPSLFGFHAAAVLLREESLKRDHNLTCHPYAKGASAKLAPLCNYFTKTHR